MNNPESNPPPNVPPAINLFATCDIKGKPVSQRFASPAALLSVYKTIKDNGIKEDERRAKIKRVYYGALPFDPEKLKGRGLSNLTNINFGEFAAQIDARADAVMGLAVDTTDLVELRARDAAEAGPDSQDIGDAIAYEFSYTLRSNQRFLSTLASCVRERDLFGLGPLCFRDRFDYQPVALERGQVKVREDAPAISTENELVFVEAPMPAWYLYQLFDDPELATKEGWNLPLVKDAIIKAFVNRFTTESDAADRTNTSVLESTVSLMRQNRIFETRQFDTLNIVHAYVHEVSGSRKISHYMAIPGILADDFIFHKPEAYDTMDQCILWLPSNALERYVRGLRGIGSRLLPVCDLNNRALCHSYDYVFRDLTLKFKSSVPLSNRLSLQEHGPFTITGPELETASGNQGGGGLQAMANLRALGRSTGEDVSVGVTGTAASPQASFTGLSGSTKAEIEANGKAGLKRERQQMAAQVTVLDALFRESFRRFMALVNSGDDTLQSRYPGVTDFIKRCGRRKIDAKLLRKVPEDFEVRMCRDLVTGGADAKATQLTETLKEFGGNMDELGRVLATRDVIGLRLGPKSADRYRPEIGRDTTASDAASHAVLENNALLQGMQALVAPNQLHWSHIPQHMQALQGLAQQVQEGQVDDPHRMLSQMEALSSHIQTHAQLGGAQIGMEDAAKRVIASLRSLRPILQNLTMMASAFDQHQERMQKLQEERQAELERRAEGQDAQVEMHKTDVKAALKSKELDQMQQVRLAGVQAKARVDAEAARLRADVDRINASGKMFRQAQTASAVPPSPMLDMTENQPPISFAPGLASGEEM